MGYSPIVVSGSSGTRTRPNNKSKNDPCVTSSGFVYLLVSFVTLVSISGIYSRFMMTPNVHSSISSIGCKEDDEGSWSIGVFYGDSPFSLKPIEDMNIWRDKSAAWPVANPVITCASTSGAGLSSNFVADPFLYIQGDVFYLFFERKNSITMQGDIGVERSTDKGASWEQLGIALDEDWHLSLNIMAIGLEESIKGRNVWNGARSHHLDVQRLSSGEWVGVMDGDRVPSGDASRRFHLGCASVFRCCSPGYTVWYIAWSC